MKMIFPPNSDKSTISDEEISKFLIENNINLEKVIELVIRTNGIIGVGLVTLNQQINDYIVEIIKLNDYRQC
jgi:hypothetical protein